MKEHYDFNSIPSELKALPQWILWKAEEKGGRYTKIPYQVNGNEARSNDRRTWSTFATAAKFYTESDANGIGFVFSRQGKYIGIDIDKCITYSADDTEKMNPIINNFAQEVIDTLDSYTEFSVGGTGIHIIIKGSLPQSVVGTGRKSAKHGLEIFQYGRYFTMTGNRDSKILEDIITKDKQDFILPIEIMFKTYQKLIGIGLSKEMLLLDFADYLRIYGPDWEDEANRIFENVDKKQLDQAIKAAETVDYNKYQNM